MTTIKIYHATNGGMVEVERKGSERPERYVYQSSEDDGMDVELFADFLRTLCDEIGPTMSRYSKKRIVVDVRPGDKYEG